MKKPFLRNFLNTHLGYFGVGVKWGVWGVWGWIPPIGGSGLGINQ